MALGLSACESSGGLRMGSVGQPSGEASVAGGADAAGTMMAGGGSVSGGGTTTAGGTTAGGATTASGSSQSPTTIGRRAILVTAGNAVLDATDRVDAARGPLSDNVPNTAPITGTVTRILGDSGQALVNAGDGSSYLVDGLTAAPGSAVTIAVGDGHLVGGPGSNPLLGVSVLSPTQTAGGVASVGVGSNGTLLTANVPANPALAGVPAAISGATGNLANGTVGNTQVAGGGQPAAIGISALSPTQADGTVLTAGAASNGNLVAVNGTSVAAPNAGTVLAGTTGTVGAATGSLADATVGSTQLVGGGQSAAIGVSALSPTQTSGSLLTVGADSAGSLATVNGTSVAAPTTGSLLGAVPTGSTTPAVSIGGTTGTLATGALGLH